ncbi:MAG: hypothetical protein A2381_11800 [Bdellovibrionales bacterium RIFOXYB1_FULL_37_110]|nr:MAG: hypothetical protein A2181_05635 [Bdellovibrionales bacterium RIFOXYA1_FULL_38_20]OFZ49239.1 MAG: hypothetical protein A2417_17040 [Bdellovibrionales bacterium RIFOXYC1_FULL_37_79]OFZ58487.1 MAG: hypothetical protein A2381_11800 [Bdellovibrionales bacterium RIFOXYB1_FULL_37_110]OFZ61500.1 MAG: hypothetical protein A2577_00320 [Bdellovibrionales bacterium RIFOXYD1_FULL_36_51]
MPRKPLLRTDQFPYHITARSNNKEWFYLPLEDVWMVFQLILKKAQEKFELEIIQFVLMSNHYHMLLRTPHSNLDVVMQFIQKNISDTINQQTNRVNHLFGGPYKWSLIDNANYFYVVIKYIFQNPLRANIVGCCEDYEYSTLYSLVNNLPLEFNHNLKGFFNYNSLENLVYFINQTFTSDQIQSIKKSLSKTAFKIAKNPNTGKKLTFSI